MVVRPEWIHSARPQTLAAAIAHPGSTGSVAYVWKARARNSASTGDALWPCARELAEMQGSPGQGILPLFK